MIELKPCPFCGYEPEIQQDIRYPGNGDGVKSYEIFCNNYKCIAYHADNKYFKTLKSAIEVWNTRKETNNYKKDGVENEKIKF